MLNTILIILQYLAPMLTGALALLALLVSYKDKEGKITRWGKIALYAIVVSIIISTTTQAIRNSQDKKVAEEKRMQQQIQLDTIKRAVFPLSNNSIAFGMMFPTDNPVIKECCIRASKGKLSPVTVKQFNDLYAEILMKQALPNLKTTPGEESDITFQYPINTSHIKDIDLRKSLTSTSLNLFFFKQPKPVNELHDNMDVFDDFKPDLIWHTNPRNSSNLLYISDCESVFSSSKSNLDNDLIEIRTGNIVSLVDLSNAQLVVQPTIDFGNIIYITNKGEPVNLDVREDDMRARKKWAKLMSSCKAIILEMNINGRIYRLPLKRVLNTDFTYYYKFPEDMTTISGDLPKLK